MRVVVNQRSLEFTPGSRYRYSNTNYLLLAEVVARVSGQSFASFAEDRIFEPLGMNSTFFHDDHERVVEGLARSYYMKESSFVEAVTTNSAVGSTNLYTTVLDLSAWLANLSDPVVGDSVLVSKMDKVGVLNDGTELSYATGNYSSTYEGKRMMQHSGSHRAYTSFLARFPESDLGVALASNYDAINPIETSLNVVDIVLGGRSNPDEDAEDDETESRAPRDGVSESAYRTERELSEYAGLFYSPELHVTYSIDADDNRLIANHVRYPSIVFDPVAEDVFEADRFYFNKIEFVRDGGGDVVGMSASNRRVEGLSFTKVRY